MITQIGLIIW